MVARQIQLTPYEQFRKWHPPAVQRPQNEINLPEYVGIVGVDDQRTYISGPDDLGQPTFHELSRYRRANRVTESEHPQRASFPPPAFWWRTDNRQPPGARE